ncbi:hypothetical protein T492DRAFT_946296 [Pavlovales sp. CCMP2436]|nr:hypothetical protein T492DRAFT_946296 [Pavlovales sp. CCMP2436]
MATATAHCFASRGSGTRACTTFSLQACLCRLSPRSLTNMRAHRSQVNTPPIRSYATVCTGAAWPPVRGGVGRGGTTPLRGTQTLRWRWYPWSERQTLKHRSHVTVATGTSSSSSSPPPPPPLPPPPPPPPSSAASSGSRWWRNRHAWRWRLSPRSVPKARGQ